MLLRAHRYRLIGWFSLGLAAVVCWSPSVREADAAGQEPPIIWKRPRNFVHYAAGLGMTKLQGAEHWVIYDPKPCKGNVNEGGDGKYESVMHGTYSHHSNIVLYKDKFIVHWTNHSKDENGPGQRVIAKIGTFNADRTAIDWGGDETMVEIAPAPVPVRRRRRKHDPDVINEHYANGTLQVINDRLYFRGHLSAVHGYTDRPEYGHPSEVAGPTPAAHWRDERDKDAGFGAEVYWSLGFSFVQRWEVQGKTIVPASPMYKLREMIDPKYEVTPGRFKTVLRPNEPYASASAFDEAPELIRNDIRAGRALSFRRHPRYASAEARRRAADGTRGLAHYAEFKRPDGKWVVIRDNLAKGKGGAYYAAVKDKEIDGYPPAIRTELPGYAMPAAGELPNGWVWILGNMRSRQDFYITVSRDGKLFRRTRHLLTIEGTPEPDSIGKKGGPQYPHAVTVGNNIAIAYSITKMKEGVTRVPIDALVSMCDDLPPMK